MSENIHIKMAYGEAKEAKVKVLSSEINILEIKKHLTKYKKLRLQELRKKEKINQKLKSVKTDIIKLEKLLPKLKMPKILKKKAKVQTKTEIIKEEIKTVQPTQSHLEKQLEDIKSKLQSLQG